MNANLDRIRTDLDALLNRLDESTAWLVDTQARGRRLLIRLAAIEAATTESEAARLTANLLLALGRFERAIKNRWPGPDARPVGLTPPRRNPSPPSPAFTSGMGGVEWSTREPASG